jgi:hypothetical protein
MLFKCTNVSTCDRGKFQAVVAKKHIRCIQMRMNMSGSNQRKRTREGENITATTSATTSTKKANIVHTRFVNSVQI